VNDGQPPRRGWTAFVEEVPAQTTLDMPGELGKKVANFVAALALEAGAAIDAGRQPPGDRLDDSGERYGISISGENVLLEYVALREIRITVLVWFH
jgi:hypothetical protein